MSRESRRDKERFERRAEQEEGTAQTPTPEAGGATAPGKSEGRTSPRQFGGEVRSELRRVHWPGRKKLTSYSVVVLVAVALLTAFIFAVDQAFGQFVLWVFG